MENAAEYLRFCKTCDVMKWLPEGVSVCTECEFTLEKFKQRVLAEKGGKIELSLGEARALLKEFEELERSNADLIWSANST
jgi:hypothetical protein